MKALYIKILCLSLGMSLLSCGTEELSGPIKISPLTPEVGLPIGKAQYTMGELFADLIDSTEVSIDSLEEVITIVFSDTLETFGNVTDFIDLGDAVTDEKTIITPASFGAGTGETRIPIPADTILYLFDPDGEEIVKEITFAQEEPGVTPTIISVTATSRSGVQLENLSLKFPSTINSATNDTLTFLFPSVTEVTSSLSESLSGYTSTFELNDANTPLTEVIVNMTATAPSGETVNAGDEILSLTVSYSNLQFESVIGYFGKKTVEIADNAIDFSFFNEITPGSIRFENPSATITTETNIGIPFGFDLRNVSAERGDTAVFLQADSEEDSIALSEGALSLGDTGFVSVDIQTGTNGYNLDDLFALSPNRFVTNLELLTNPEVDESSPDFPPLDNFLTRDAFAKPTVDIELPFSVSIEGLTISLAQDLTDFENPEQLDSAFLRINTSNELPLVGTVSLNVYKDGIVQREVFVGDTIISPPKLTASFALEAPGVKTSLILLDQLAIQDFQQGDSLTIDITVDNTQISNTILGRTIFYDINKEASLKFNLSILASTKIEF